MSVSADSRVVFRKLVKARGGPRKVGRELHVSHAAVIAWSTGRSVPGPAFREAIDRWSSGDVPAIGWKLNKRERDLLERAGLVTAAESGELPAIDAKSTGTDSSS